MKAVATFILFACSATFLVWSFGTRGSGSYPVLYTQVLLAGVCVLIALILFEELQAIRVSETGAPFEATISWQAVAGLLAILVYVMIWELVGHGAATALFLFATLLIAGERSPLTILSLVVLVPVGIHFLFIEFLRIPLPRVW